MSGPVLIGISAFFFASYGVWSKLMAGYFGEFNQAVVKAVVLLAVLIPYFLISKSFKRIQKGDWKWFVAIAVAGGLNQAPYFYGFEYLSVGTATLLFYAALTLGAYFLGRVFFGEKLGWAKVVSLGMAMAGLWVIYEFHLQPGQIFPASCAFVAGLLGATGVVLSKKLSGNYSEVQIISGYLIAMIIFNPILSWAAGEQLPGFTAWTPWLAQAGYAMAYLVANIAVVAGFRRLDPSIGALIGLLEVIFAAVFGVVVFGESMTTQLIAGSTLIIFAAALPDLCGVVRRVGGRYKEQFRRKR